MAKAFKNENERAYLLNGVRALNDCYAPVREESIRQKREKAYYFFRLVSGFSIAKSLRLVNEMHPLER